jgi:hypothetical protein
MIRAISAKKYFFYVVRIFSSMQVGVKLFHPNTFHNGMKTGKSKIYYFSYMWKNFPFSPRLPRTHEYCGWNSSLLCISLAFLHVVNIFYHHLIVNTFTFIGFEQCGAEERYKISFNLKQNFRFRKREMKTIYLMTFWDLWILAWYMVENKNKMG